MSVFRYWELTKSRLRRAALARFPRRPVPVRLALFGHELPVDDRVRLAPAFEARAADGRVATFQSLDSETLAPRTQSGLREGQGLNIRAFCGLSEPRWTALKYVLVSYAASCAYLLSLHRWCRAHIWSTRGRGNIGGTAVAWLRQCDSSQSSAASHAPHPSSSRPRARSPCARKQPSSSG